MDLYLDWNAFWHLSGSRQTGMGLGSIQVSEVYAYMQMFEMNDYEERKTFLRRIQILDSVYLNHHNEAMKDREEKMKKQRSKSTPPRPPKRR